MAFWVTYTSVSPHQGGTAIAQVVAAARKPTKPNSPLEVFAQPPTGPYSTRAAAKAVADKYNKSHVYTIPSPGNPLSGINAIGDFFNRLTQAQTWIRVGEVVAGGLLLYLGLKAVVTPAGANVGKQTVKQTAHHVVEGAKKVAEVAAAA